MKRLPAPSTEMFALACLAGLGIGVVLVAGVGWALIVVSALILAYIILPDQSPGGPA